MFLQVCWAFSSTVVPTASPQPGSCIVWKPAASSNQQLSPDTLVRHLPMNRFHQHPEEQISGKITKATSLPFNEPLLCLLQKILIQSPCVFYEGVLFLRCSVSAVGIIPVLLSVMPIVSVLTEESGVNVSLCSCMWLYQLTCFVDWNVDSEVVYSWWDWIARATWHNLEKKLQRLIGVG